MKICPTCPKCGQPMKVVREKLGEQWCRAWRCKNWYAMGDQVCLTTEKMTDDEPLSIAEIAEDMAHRAFSSSHEQGKKQAGFRRIAGSIKKLDAGRVYLSDGELKTLDAAAEILDRLGTAAEKAKKEKKRIEKEEKQRIECRRSEASTLIHSLFQDDDLVGMAINTLVLAKTDSERAHAPWAAGWVKNIQSRSGNKKTLSVVLKGYIQSEFDHYRVSLTGTIARRNEPVAELMKKVRVRFNELRDSESRSPVIDELREALAVETGSNVVRLERGTERE